MKNVCTLVVALICFFSTALAQNPPVARTDVYHVHFAKATLGKGAEEGDFLKRQGPNPPMPGHYLVLRHQSGEDWDYVAIEHLGTKTTVNAATPPPPAGARDLNAWHTDSFVSGPPWPDFARAMGLDDAAKSAGSVYLVSVFRAAPEHREQLERALSQPPGPPETIGGTVLMQHLEGGPWHFLTLTRYNSWQDFATSQKASAADTLKAGGGWLEVRNHSTFHNDTVADRIAP